MMMVHDVPSTQLSNTDKISNEIVTKVIVL